ncbi:MAG: 2-hydroxyacid dehydrogenase [Alphaproteobacteria bacterium]
MQAKPNVLVVVKPPDNVVARLERDFTLLKLWELGSDETAALRRVADRVQVLFTFNRYLTPDFLDPLPNLKLICCFGAGFDRVPMDYCRQRGIRATNGPDTNAGCVADAAMGLLLATQRRIAAGDRFLRRGGWLKQRLYDTTSRFYGRRLGLLGFGYINAAVAKRARGFDLEIAYCTRNRRPDVAYRWEPDLIALARWADYLVAAIPLDATTRHIINRPVIEALGPKGMFVNVSRGPIVDQPESSAALQDGRRAARGSTCSTANSHVPAELMALDNVVLTPHVGGMTHESFADGAELLARNITAFYAGRPLITPLL